MVLSDFIGTMVELNGEKITISFVGKKNNYIMFAYENSKGEFIIINSNEVKIKIEYINRPALHGTTKFIGSHTINAYWTDDEGQLVKKGKYVNRDAPLSDVRLSTR